MKTDSTLMRVKRITLKRLRQIGDRNMTDDDVVTALLDNRDISNSEPMFNSSVQLETPNKEP